MQLSLRNYSTHEMSKDQMSRDTVAPTGQQALDASPPAWTPLRSVGMGTRQLMAYPRNKPDWIEYQIELHRRFALPVACLMLAMVGIPLGIATRKGGRAAGYVNAIFVAFFCYYLAFVSLLGLARQKTLPVPVALWLPNAVFFVAGLIFLARLEKPGDSDFFGDLRACVGGLLQSAEDPRHRQRIAPGLAGWRLPLLPQLVDTYILSTFLTYLVLMLASFVSLVLIFNFFELISDMLRNNISLWKMFTYLFFLSPQLIYDLLPPSVLVAVLAAFGVMSKQNEITAFKACGVSLFRLAAPVLLGSMLLSGGLFAFDFYYVAGANRKQDALRDEIKGRATQTYLKPDRKWIMGYNSSRIFNYKYFDNSGEESSMNEASVFELEPKTFRLVRQIYARKAHWSVPLKTWVFEDGWTCEYKGAFCHVYTPFQATTFRELTEPPDYFLKEALQDKQMNFLQLDRYITGPDAERLRRYGQAAGAALPQVLGAAVRADDGHDRDPVRLPGGQSRRHGGRGPEPRDCGRLSRHRPVVREVRRRRPVGPGDGRLGPGRGLRPGRVYLCSACGVNRSWAWRYSCPARSPRRHAAGTAVLRDRRVVT